MPFYFMPELRTYVDLLPENLKVLKNEAELNEDVTWAGLVKKKVTGEFGGGRFDPNVGYVLRVVAVEKVGDGVLQPQTGMIRHEVVYSSIVLFPVRGEVVDAQVFEVKKSSVTFQYAGLVFGIVNLVNFPEEDDFVHQKICKVSTSPEEEAAEELAAFVSLSNPSKVMKKGVTIRVRIAYRKIGVDGYWLVGTMRGKFLGIREIITKTE